MVSTLITTKDGKMILSKTLVETAKVMTDMRGGFHARDLIFALHSQGVEVTERQIRASLSYDGGTYTGRHCPKSYYVLLKKPAGWYAWKNVEMGHATR